MVINMCSRRIYIQKLSTASQGLPLEKFLREREWNNIPRPRQQVKADTLKAFHYVLGYTEMLKGGGSEHQLLAAMSPLVPQQEYGENREEDRPPNNSHEPHTALKVYLVCPPMQSRPAM